ncbi:MAG: tetratricopeptide repeat protein [Myxococcales bacterium]
MRWTLILAAAAMACAHAPERKPAAPDRAAERRHLLELPAAILHQEARALMVEKKWEAAQDRLEAYLAKEPGNAVALFESGWLAEQRADPGAALDFYRRALAADPAQAIAALNLARLLRDAPAEAEKVLRSALDHLAGDPRLLDALAGALRAQKKLDEAEDAVRKVLERHPRDAGAFRTLAAIESDRGRVRLAESALNNARKLDPDDAGILNSLGLLALRRDDSAAARADFEEAVRLDPSYAPAWANLGALALRYRDYAAAEQACAKALQSDPARWQTRLARAWALEGLHRPAEARAEYEKVLEVDPAQDDALYGRALALKAEGNLEAASAAFRRYIALAHAAHPKEARTQLAAIDLRLRNAPGAPGAPGDSAAKLEVSTLPQADGTAPAARQTREGEQPAVVR